jgi:hypothetical protein
VMKIVLNRGLFFGQNKVFTSSRLQKMPKQVNNKHFGANGGRYSHIGLYRLEVMYNYRMTNLRKYNLYIAYSSYLIVTLLALLWLFSTSFNEIIATGPGSSLLQKSISLGCFILSLVAIPFANRALKEESSPKKRILIRLIMGLGIVLSLYWFAWSFLMFFVCNTPNSCQ